MKIATSKEVIYLTYEMKTKETEEILHFLETELNLPKILIKEMKQNPACRKIEDAIWQICYKNKKVMTLIYDSKAMAIIKKTFPMKQREGK